MKKTVVLIRSNPVNPDPPVEKMARALCEFNYNVVILAWDREENYSCKKAKIKYNDKTIIIYRWGIRSSFGGGIKNLKALMLFQRRIYEFLKRNHKKINIIHAYDFDTGYISQKIAQKYHKKFVYQILDYYAACHTSNPKVYVVLSKLENGLINKADAVFICTEERKKQIKGSVPKKLEVIHNCPESLSIEGVADIEKKTKNTISVAYIGIFWEHRFLKELLEVVEQDERLELNIGGYGMLAEDIKKASSACSRIHNYGRIPYEKTLQLEQDSDFMIAMYDPAIENHKFSAPNKVYESMMLGKPIIMAKGTGWDQVIEDNNLGVIVDYSVEGFKAGVSKMVDMIQKKEYNPTQAQELYKNEYSWDIMKKRIERTYRDIESC